MTTWTWVWILIGAMALAFVAGAILMVVGFCRDVIKLWRGL